jgi:anti-anti-sigma factor
MSRAERDVWLAADGQVPARPHRGLRLVHASDPPPGGGFTVSVTGFRSRTVVRPVGELDLSTVDALEESLEEALREHPAELVVDLRLLQFCDAAGLHVFLRIQQQAATVGTRLWLERPTRTVRRVLEISALDWMVDEAASLDGA